MEKNYNNRSWNDSLENFSIDSYVLLQKLNNEATTLYIPVIAFLSVSLFIGTFGNLLVIIIYTYRQKKSSSDYFILCLSFLDLITCFAGIPLEITDLCLSYTFYLAIVCKLRAIEYWTNTSSAALLVVISIDRYKRICQYGKKIRNKTAKMLCFMSLLIGGLLSWPAAIILGTKTVDLQIPRKNGSDCAHSEEMKKSAFVLIYYIVGLLCFITCVVFLTVVYVKILLFIAKAKTLKRKNIGNLNCHGKFNADINSPLARIDNSSCLEGSIQTRDDGDAIAEVEQTKEGATRTTSDVKVTRTTTILAAITIAFILSYPPYLAAMVTSTAIPDLEYRITDLPRVIYKLATKSVFLNNALNPLIYSFLSPKFRSELRSLLSCKRIRN